MPMPIYQQVELGDMVEMIINIIIKIFTSLSILCDVANICKITSDNELLN